MFTDVDVCNKALGFLEAGEISSLEENSANAIACRAVYDSVRDSVLADYPWEFATFIEDTLTLIAAETLIGWAYLYQKPEKCVAIRKLFTDDSSTSPDPIDFRQCISPTTFKPAIAVNELDPYLEYTYRVTDPSQWSIKFIEAMALRMAAEIGARVTGKKENATEAANRYAIAISEAKRLDAGGKRVTTTKASSYETAR